MLTSSGRFSDDSSVVFDGLSGLVHPIFQASDSGKGLPQLALNDR
jgi:hypothetical protein